VVIVAGGDGTVAPAATVLLETKVTLGILPFGSYMNIANGLGLPLKPIERPASSRNGRSSARTSARSRERCSLRPAASESTRICSARLASPSAAVGGRRSGGSCAGRPQTHIALRSLLTARTERHRVLQILIVNSPYYGWAMPVAPNADMTDGELDVAIFPRMGRFELIGWMARIWHTGRPGKPPRVLRGKVIEIGSSEPVSGPRGRSDGGPAPGHRTLLRRRATRIRMNLRPMSTHVRTWMPRPDSVPVTLPSAERYQELPAESRRARRPRRRGDLYRSV